MATNFGTIDYNSAPAKNNCTLFSPTPYFRARTMQWRHVNFSPEDSCCHGNQPFLFKDKIGCRLTRASNAETQLLGHIVWRWDRYLVPQNVFLVVQKFLSKNRNLGVRTQLWRNLWAEMCSVCREIHFLFLFSFFLFLSIL